jgi:hypothetical protein
VEMLELIDQLCAEITFVHNVKQDVHLLHLHQSQ